MPEPSRFPALIAAGLCMAMMGAAGSGRAQSPALALKPAPALPSGPTRLSELAARALEVQPVIRGAEARERAEFTGAVRWILNDAFVASFGPVLAEMLGSSVYSAQARAVAKRNAGYNVDRVVATVADIVEAVAVPGGDATDARHP